jgi:hypothetical protein
MEKQTDKRIELVIARHNESLDWLKEEPFCNYYHTIYNKGNDTNFYVNFKTLNVLSLENIGRESHTYLKHIILRYDTLPTLTVFLPGSLDKNLNKKWKARYILTFFQKDKKYNTTMPGVYHEGPIQKELYHFQIDTWCSKLKMDKFTGPNSILDPCMIRPFGKWHKHVFGDIETRIVPYGGVFSVSYDDIKKHKKKRYETLLEIMEYENSSNPEVGHYMERSWEAVFYPLNKNRNIVSLLY